MLRVWVKDNFVTRDIMCWMTYSSLRLWLRWLDCFCLTSHLPSFPLSHALLWLEVDESDSRSNHGRRVLIYGVTCHQGSVTENIRKPIIFGFQTFSSHLLIKWHLSFCIGLHGWSRYWLWLSRVGVSCLEKEVFCVRGGCDSGVLCWPARH